MEAPHCRNCGTKHWSREPCPAMKDVRVGPVVTSTPLLRRVAEEVKKIEAKKPAAQKVGDDTDLVSARRPITKAETIDWSQCPHCAERRRKHAERIARYRKKLT